MSALSSAPQAEQTKDQRFVPPTVSLPKGGGAIKGIGEKFDTNPVTGTGSLSIPLPLSPGRSGFTPALALSYDSGAANGPYGFGWSVGYPHITRRTDRGLPRYDDMVESDVYILSGAEDLVPVLRANGSRFEELRDGYRVRRYRPRIEGLFSRIERWSNANDASDTFWRSVSRDDVTTVYGRNASSRIADPADPTRIFTWLLCESFDDKGNAAVYDYVAEDGRGVDLRRPSESNRTEAARSANRYLKRVRYGNRTSRLVESDLSRTDWLFEMVMDYGDHEAANPGPVPTRAWSVRPDPFSSSRGRFEVRTYRRCQRILMFHRFPELGAEPKLVRSLALEYDDQSPVSGHDARAELDHAGSTQLGSFLKRALLTGFADDGFARSMPPLELTYSRPVVSAEIQVLDEASAANLPAGVDGGRARWVDLDGEGISGVLSEYAGAWWYKPNRGQGRLAPQQLVARLPSLAAPGGTQLLDLAGDGHLDLVELARPVAGFFDRDDTRDWSPFRAFPSQPNIAWNDRNLRFVDLTGDGLADVLITEDNVICWHPSLGEDGFGARQLSPTPHDEDAGPRVVFADATDTLFLADMSGDGLADLVRVRNGEVCYWPNLGYGRFGRKVTLDSAPVFDSPDQFDPRRLRLADIDGSGTVDIIYLGRDGVRLYFNRCGNGWTSEYRLPSFPPIDNLATVNVVDLLGTGTACLVWSTPLPSGARAPLRYVDLMAEGKPHLLVQVENNLGARTRIEYATSTDFYLADQEAGRPWITRLPFPVHVVERVETIDEISRNRFVTRYAYHHGFYDGFEREFRGFGMVEQRDTEELFALSADQDLWPATNVDAASNVPPVLTRTWFHTGVYFGREHISDFFAGLLDAEDVGEYYREPGWTDAEARRFLLEDTVLPPGLGLEAAREACRALKGAMLRQEVYALDGTAKERHPYTVTEQNFTIRLLQPHGPNLHAVFLTHARESIGYQYDRVPHDPRVAHSLTLEVDDFGNVRKSAAVAYGRRRVDPRLEPRDQQKQAALHVTCVETDFTNAVDGADAYRFPIASESRSYHVTGMDLAADRVRFTLYELIAATSAAVDIRYEQTPTAGRLERRIIEHARTLYRRDDLDGALPLGRVESRALPHETYRLALTPELVMQVYGDRVTDRMLEDDGRYVHSEGDARWWIPSGRIFYSEGPGDTPAVERAEAGAHFFAPRRFRDPFGNDVRVTYDVYDLAVLETRDPLGNVATSEIDYRVLQPRVVTDPNGNRRAAAFDALGMVSGTAVMGKIDETPRCGDSLEGFRVDLPDAVIRAHLADPLSDPHEILGRASTRVVYDLFAYYRTRGGARSAPAVAYALARETHDADLPPGERTKVQHAFSYSDGFGREVQKKAQAEPGPVPRRDPTTGRIVVGDGQPVLTDERRVRWVGSGWTIFNNKGQPVRQFEPFFTDTQGFEDDVRVGVSPILSYDPVGRVVATAHPNHTWEKVVFDPWRQETWDVNDTVLIADPRDDADVGQWLTRLDPADVVPTWFAARSAGALGADERAGATKTAVHAVTPSVAHRDSLGRTFLTVAHNRFKLQGAAPDAPPTEEFYATRVELDIEGTERFVTDALDRVIMRYDYDLLSRRIHQASMEAGERWMLSNVGSQPIYAWNSRGFRFRSTYDALRRPAESFVQGADPQAPAREILFGMTEYGEGQPDDVALNLRGRAFRVHDTAGVVTSGLYDFKGNPLAARRQLAKDYKSTPDWSGSLELESELFETRTTYDALNRPVSTTTPDNSVYRPTFNEANLLERVNVNLRGAADATTFVTNIDYDAKGQRQAIEYGNGVRTDYTYDPLTFRLVELSTVRPSDRTVLQDLLYTFDPIGNITQIRDRAQQTLYFNNQVVTPDNDYVYDAVYRLINATGREHIGQASHPETTWDDRFRVNLHHPGDGQAMRRYREVYRYDAVGNFLLMSHRADGGNWTRAYTFNEASLLEAGARSNRLSNTQVGDTTSEVYQYDAHGNMTSMPQLQSIQWDFKDALGMSQRQAVTFEDDPVRQGERTYYVYDVDGKRVRKVTQSAAGSKREERFYFGSFEMYRAYAGGSISVERETLHVADGRQRIALVDIRTQGDDGSPLRSVRYQLSNHLGSASVELDDGASLISSEEYYPYGSTSYQAVRASLDIVLKRYRYAGMERDEETGLSYQGARYYSCWLGRWTSSEPTPLIDGTNLYAYVKGNPVIFTDPSGHGPNDQRLGAKNEKAIAKQQKAADKRRVQEKRTPVEVNRQKGVGGKREVIPDEVKWLRGGTSDQHVIEAKGRHVGSKANQSASERIVDIRENLEQAKTQLQALEAAGEVGKTAKASVLRVIWDSDRGKSSTAARATWNKEAKDTRNSWVNEATDPAERALRERVNVTTTTHDRLLEATAESKSRAKLRSGPGGGLMGTAVNILSVLDIASDVSKKDYASAGIKGSLLVVGTKVPGVGEALFGVAVILKSRDPALRNISMSIGESVEDYTGSHVGGALAAAAAHVVITVGATVKDMVWGLVPSDIQWGIQWAIEHNSPGSLIPTGVATPFIMHGGAGSFLRSPADAYRDLNHADYTMQ